MRLFYLFSKNTVFSYFLHLTGTALDGGASLNIPVFLSLHLSYISFTRQMVGQFIINAIFMLYLHCTALWHATCNRKTMFGVDEKRPCWLFFNRNQTLIMAINTLIRNRIASLASIEMIDLDAQFGHFREINTPVGRYEA